MTPGNKLVEGPKLLSHVRNKGSWERKATSRSSNEEPHPETHVEVTRTWKQNLFSCWGLLLPWRQELSLAAVFRSRRSLIHVLLPYAACSHETFDNVTPSKLANTSYFSVVVLVWV